MKFNVKKEPQDDVKRSEILDAAFQSIYEKGAKAASLRTIAEEARITQGHLYYYYKSKKLLIADLYQRILDKTIDSMERQLAGSRSARDRLNGYLEEGVKFARESNKVMIVLQEIWLLGKRDKELRAMFAEHIRKLALVLDNILEQAEQEKIVVDLRGESYALHIMYHAFIIGMGLLQQFGSNVADGKAFDLMRQGMKHLILGDISEANLAKADKNASPGKQRDSLRAGK